MARSKERIRAREKRMKGESIKVIAKELSVSPSSVSLWCRDIVLSEKQIRTLETRRNERGVAGRLLGAEANRQKKRDALSLALKSARNKIGLVSKRDRFIAGLALYWAEGSKSVDPKFSFVNSDTKMLLLTKRWLQDFFGVRNEDFILRVAINEIHRPRNKIVLKYWTELLDIPPAQFRQTSFTKTKQQKIYANHDTYFGTLVMRVRRSNQLRAEILSCIEIMKSSG